MSDERILVIGIGNPLMRDEGIGPRVAEMLMAGYDFPENVEVVDAGTMGLMLLDLLRGVDHLIVADAIKGTGHRPGTVLVLTPEDLASNQVMHSMHDIRLVDVLQNAALLDRAPETVVIGVQIDTIEEWVLELSPAVAEALPVAAAAVIEQLRALGVEPTARKDSNVDAQIIKALRTYAPMPESSLMPEAESPSKG